MHRGNKIGVVILNYNNCGETIDLFKSIKEYKVFDDIIIVDNCSTDHSLKKLLLLNGNNLSVVESNRNGGYSYGNNYGARLLLHNRVDIIFIANPDVRFSEFFVKKIADNIIENKCDACTGLMFNCKGEIQDFGTRINSYRDDCVDCTLLLKKFLRSDIGSIREEKGGLKDTEILPGSLFAVRATAFYKAGGFDDQVFLYCEERIVARRLMGIGCSLKVDTDVNFIHDHSTSINKSLSYFKQVRQMFQSRLYYDQYYRKSKSFRHAFLKLMMWYGMGIRKLFWPLIKRQLTRDSI